MDSSNKLRFAQIQHKHQQLPDCKVIELLYRQINERDREITNLCALEQSLIQTEAENRDLQQQCVHLNVDRRAWKRIQEELDVKVNEVKTELRQFKGDDSSDFYSHR
jgi:flagellar biosynthesis regulator FlaF